MKIIIINSNIKSLEITINQLSKESNTLIHLLPDFVETLEVLLEAFDWPGLKKPDFGLFASSFPLEAKSNAFCRSPGSSSLRTWIPSPFPHLDPPSKQNRPPSNPP